MIGASLLYAAYAVALRSRPAASALAFFAVMAGAAFVTSIPFALYEWLAGDLIWPNRTGWGLIVAIALLPSLLSQLLFMRGVELIGPGRAGLFVNLTPVLASALAVLLLGEQFHWYHAAALAPRVRRHLVVGARQPRVSEHLCAVSSSMQEVQMQEVQMQEALPVQRRPRSRSSRLSSASPSVS